MRYDLRLCAKPFSAQTIAGLVFVTICLANANRVNAFRVLDLTSDGMGISRWNAVYHTVDGIERSLDGGIRFSMTGGSYEAFIEEFHWQDDDVPTVEQFQAMIESVFAEWQQVDPATGLGTSLRFVPDFDTEVVANDPDNPFQLAQGSEFDLIADPSVDFAGGARLFGDPATNTVTLTSGVGNYPAAVISGADLIFGTQGGHAGSWALDSFRSVFSQMVGLSLGMEWADVFHACDDCYPVSPFYDDNYDGSTDETAIDTLTNSFAHLVDPLDPNNSPALGKFEICPEPDQEGRDYPECFGAPGIDSPGVDLLLEIGPDGDLTRWQLTNDDFAARQFLYPVRQTGDLNGDHELTVEDIDLLSAEVRKMEARSWFDQNGDGLVNDDDRTEWVKEQKGTWIGDANLDGEFDTGDLVAVFQAGHYEDNIAGNSTWETGDWNGDGEFDTGDLVSAFQDGGFEKGRRAAVTTVPEPSLYASLFIGFLFLARQQRGSRDARFAA